MPNRLSNFLNKQLCYSTSQGVLAGTTGMSVG
jgi:hypothetical protein